MRFQGPTKWSVVGTGKTIAVGLLVAFTILTASYLVTDSYQNGNPFNLTSAPNLTTVAYAFSINMTTGGQVIGGADLRVGIFLTFDTSVIAGQEVGLSARAIIPLDANPRVRNASVVGVFIPNAAISPKLNDTSHGIPNDFYLGLQNVENDSGSRIFGYGPTTSPIPIYFPDQGDYHVLVIIQGRGYSSGLIEPQNTVIHVEPRSMEQSILLGRESRTFTFALLVFAIMGGLVLLPDFYRGSLLEEYFRRYNQQREETRPTDD